MFTKLNRLSAARLSRNFHPFPLATISLNNSSLCPPIQSPFISHALMQGGAQQQKYSKTYSEAYQKKISKARSKKFWHFYKIWFFRIASGLILTGVLAFFGYWSYKRYYRDRNPLMMDESDRLAAQKEHEEILAKLKTVDIANQILIPQFNTTIPLFVPKHCRKEEIYIERDIIEKNIAKAILNNSIHAINYISGLPGMGKSRTIRAAYNRAVEMKRENPSQYKNIELLFLSFESLNTTTSTDHTEILNTIFEQSWNTSNGSVNMSEYPIEEPYDEWDGFRSALDHSINQMTYSSAKSKLFSKNKSAQAAANAKRVVLVMDAPEHMLFNQEVFRKMRNTLAQLMHNKKLACVAVSNPDANIFYNSFATISRHEELCVAINTEGIPENKRDAGETSSVQNMVNPNFPFLELSEVKNYLKRNCTHYSPAKHAQFSFWLHKFTIGFPLLLSDFVLEGLNSIDLNTFEKIASSQEDFTEWASIFAEDWYERKYLGEVVSHQMTKYFVGSNVARHAQQILTYSTRQVLNEAHLLQQIQQTRALVENRVTQQQFQESLTSSMPEYEIITKVTSMKPKDANAASQLEKEWNTLLGRKPGGDDSDEMTVDENVLRLISDRLTSANLVHTFLLGNLCYLCLPQAFWIKYGVVLQPFQQYWLKHTPEYITDIVASALIKENLN